MDEVNVSYTIMNRLFFLLGLLRVAAEALGKVQFGFDLGQQFTMLFGLRAGEFAAFTAQVAPSVIFLLCGP